MPGVMSKIANVGNYGFQQKRIVIPVIPLEKPEEKQLKPGEFHKYKLRTVPTNEKSTTYELDIEFFDNGTPEKWLMTRRAILQVIHGQNITDYPEQCNAARRVLRGQSLTAFETSVLAQQNMIGKMVDPKDPSKGTFRVKIENDLDMVTRHVFPPRAYQTQKRWMRRFLRKPKDMTTIKFVSRVKEINEYFDVFPFLENGRDPKKLKDDELLDIFEFGMPPSWQAEFLLQGFDPVSNSIERFVEICTTIETVEACNANSENKKRKGSDDSKGSPNKKRRGERTGKYNCLLHGPNNTHETGDCKVLKANVAKLKKDSSDKKPSFGFGNKKRKEDLQAITNAVVEALYSQNKKKDKKKGKEAHASEDTETTSVENYDQNSSDNSSDSSDEE